MTDWRPFKAPRKRASVFRDKARALVATLAGSLIGASLLASTGVHAGIVLVPRVLITPDGPIVRLLPRFVPDPPTTTTLLPGLTTVTDTKWSERAVRQVLHVFAYGGQAADEQISTWANMAPEVAIGEMLTFDEHNLKLSKPSSLDNDNLAGRSGTLRGLAQYFNGTQRIETNRRDYFRDTSYATTYTTWLLAGTMRGLNPFRQKIGLFETNYHMAVNHAAGVTPRQMVTYYDNIMESLESGERYEDTLTEAAASAAVASQYGHRYNRWRYNWDTLQFECFCNDDFAREYHQLFFGILGVEDPEYHEQVTIENTSMALTGIVPNPRADEEEWQTDRLNYLDFDPDDDNGVAPGPLEILEMDVTGTNVPDRLAEASDIAIEHPESLDNLPLIVVQELADDVLSNRERVALRTAWAAMDEKDLLRFIRAYAVSTLFHSPNRAKHLTSIDRFQLITNLTYHSNKPLYRNLQSDWIVLWTEEIQPFYPLHDVFGHQRGLEAAASAGLFRTHWLYSTRNGWRFYNARTDSAGVEVVQDWGAKAPREANGSYKVATVARWLWERFIADGGANYGLVERAQLHALLAREDAFEYVVDGEETDRVINSSEIASTPSLRSLVSTMGNETLALRSTDTNTRDRANQRMGQGVAFVASTPFMFVRVGS